MEKQVIGGDFWTSIILVATEYRKRQIMGDIQTLGVATIWALATISLPLKLLKIVRNYSRSDVLCVGCT